MENYEMIYLVERVKFMESLGKAGDAQSIVEREVPYVAFEGNNGNFELIKLFLKNFKHLLTEESSSKLNEIYQSLKTNRDCQQGGLSL